MAGLPAFLFPDAADDKIHPGIVFVIEIQVAEISGVALWFVRATVFVLTGLN